MTSPSPVLTSFLIFMCLVSVLNCFKVVLKQHSSSQCTHAYMSWLSIQNPWSATSPQCLHSCQCAWSTNHRLHFRGLHLHPFPSCSNCWINLYIAPLLCINPCALIISVHSTFLTVSPLLALFKRSPHNLLALFQGSLCNLLALFRGFM